MNFVSLLAQVASTVEVVVGEQPVMTRSSFLEGSEMFLHLESHSKIPNLMITEVFYLLIWTEVFFIQDVSGVYTSLFLDKDN